MSVFSICYEIDFMMILEKLFRTLKQGEKMLEFWNVRILGDSEKNMEKEKWRTDSNS